MKWHERWYQYRKHVEYYVRGRTHVTKYSDYIGLEIQERSEEGGNPVIQCNMYCTLYLLSLENEANKICHIDWQFDCFTNRVITTLL